MKAYLIRQYERYERHISSLGLVAGFIFDALTLKRADEFWENFWIGGHLLLAAVGIIALNYYFHRMPQARGAYRVYSFQFWLIFIIQFAFGGLLSAFLVFYFRSSTLAASWPFLLLLASAFIGNEIFKRHYARLFYQIGILFISVFSFAIFVLPVILRRMGTGTFLLSGFVSLALIALFLLLLRWFSRDDFVAVVGRLPSLS